jgi:PAS domain S-box-containing protein
MVATNPEERILILAPVGQDAMAMGALLHAHGFGATVCAAAGEACDQLKKGAAVLLVTEEALELPQVPALFHQLETQPPWGELPLIVLTHGGESRLARLLHLAAQAAGSITLLERPLGEATLVRSIEVALRSRRRQYQVRDLLEHQRLVHQELRESEEKYRTLFESIDQGFCTIQVLFDEQDKPVDYRFLSVNPGFERQTGMRDSVGRRMREIAPFHETHWFDTYGTIALTGEPMRFENEAAQFHRHYDVYAWRIGEPAERKVAVLFNDITQRKTSHARLEQFAEELERQVSERTHELVSSQDQLRALATELNLAEQRERQRLAAELHDHLAQMLVLVRLKLGQAKQGPVQRSMDMIKQAEDVVNESLTYTRNLVAELSPPVLHEFGLLQSVRIPAVNTLHIPEDQAVLIFQSVRELLINAAKHAVSKQAFLAAEEGEGCLRIVVEDQGVGFDLRAMAIPTPSPMSSKFGLFSIRERMNALGGRFELHSAPGEGTRATLVLPLSPSPQSARPARGSTMSIHETPAHPNDQSGLGHGPCRVLIADDHAMVRQGLRSVLEGFPDVSVIGEASNGQEAMDLTEQLKPSAVVMDINMPVMNGIEATALIRKKHPHIAIIGMSVNASVDNHDAMHTAGACLLLTKEAAVEQLHGAIQQAVKAIGGTL